MKMTKMIGTAAVVAVAVFLATNAVAKDRTAGRGTGPVVYVESQGLFYDSIVLADLPPNGRFQQLKPGVGPSGLATEYGPATWDISPVAGGSMPTKTGSWTMVTHFSFARFSARVAVSCDSLIT